MVITLVIVTCAVVVGIRVRWTPSSVRVPSEPDPGSRVRTDPWQVVAACAGVLGVVVALAGLVWA